MSGFNRFLDMMKLDPYTEDVEEDDEDEIEAAREVKKTTAAKRKARIEEPEEDDVEEEVPVREQKKKTVRFADRSSRQSSADRNTQVRKKPQVSMIVARSADDSEQIVDMLISGQAVVMNLETISLADAQRIIDFVGGACYSLGGNLQGISSKIFFVAPGEVDISGDFIELISDSLDMSTLNLSF